MLSEKKLQQVREMAEKYKDVPAKFGEDIDLSMYPTPKENLLKVESLKDLNEDHKQALANVGVDIEEKSTVGSYVQVNSDAIYSKMYSDIILMPITEALEKFRT